MGEFGVTTRPFNWDTSVEAVKTAIYVRYLLQIKTGVVKSVDSGPRGGRMIALGTPEGHDSSVGTTSCAEWKEAPRPNAPFRAQSLRHGYDIVPVLPQIQMLMP